MDEPDGPRPDAAHHTRCADHVDEGRVDGSPGGVALAGHLTIIEACLVLGVSAATVLEWTRAGTIPCTQTRAHGLVVPAWAVVQVLLSTSGPG